MKNILNYFLSDDDYEGAINVSSSHIITVGNCSYDLFLVVDGVSYYKHTYNTFLEAYIVVAKIEGFYNGQF